MQHGSFSRMLAHAMGRIAPRSFFPHGASAPEGGPFRPKLLAVLKNGYSAADFGKDAVAGLTVGVVAMPLAMAFAIASGVDPVQGLYTAIIAGLVIALLGGSRYQISGPTGAFVVIIYGIVYRHGYDGLVLTTLIAGCLLALGDCSGSVRSLNSFRTR